jgi:hypothetical protein
MPIAASEHASRALSAPRPRRTVMHHGRAIAAALLLNAAAGPTAAIDPHPQVANMAVIEQRLAATQAVGVFTKLSIKRDADRLHAALREHHAGSGKASLDELRERFDLLVQAIVLLLQDKEPDLARPGACRGPAHHPRAERRALRTGHGRRATRRAGLRSDLQRGRQVARDFVTSSRLAHSPNITPVSLGCTLTTVVFVVCTAAPPYSS